MAQVSFDFKYFPQAKKGGFANNIVINMTGNEHFMTIQTEVVLLKTLFEAFSEAAAAAVNGGSDRILTKNNRLEAMTNQLVVLGRYVDILSKGEERIIMSSGFPMRSQVITPSTVTTPTGLVVENLTQDGIIVAGWDDMAGAVNYAIETMVEGETWKNGQYRTTCKKNILGPFPQGKKVFVKVKANGTGAKTTGWCEPQSVYVS